MRSAALTAVLSAGTFLTVFDGQVITVALPDISDDLGLTPVDAQWVVTAYVLTFGGFLLLGGRLGDRFGRRRILVVGLVAFGAGLVLAGVATHLAVVLAGRVVQGCGAALVWPTTFAVISSLTAARRRRRVLATASVCGSGAAVMGAVLGGLVTEDLGWQYVFLLSAPVAFAAAAVAAVVVPDDRAHGAPRRLDLVAALLSTGAVALLVASLSSAGQEDRLTWVVLGFAAAVVLLVALVIWERRTVDPLLPLWLWSVRSLRAASVAMPAQVFAYNGTVFVGLLFLQQALGYSPLEAGWAFAPLGLAAALGGPVAGRLLRTRRWTSVACVALVVCAAGSGLLAAAGDGDAFALRILPGLVLVGFGVSLAVVPLTEAAGRDVPASDKGVCYGLFGTVTHVSGALTVAVLAMVLVAPEVVAGMEGHVAVVTGFQWAFGLTAGVAGLGAVVLAIYGRRLRRAPPSGTRVVGRPRH